MIETIDAEPLVFDFTKNSSSSCDDTASIYSTTSNFTTYTTQDDYLDPEDLRYYLGLLDERPYEFMPPVAGGLPPLEAMNIPYYDPLQYKLNPSQTQQAVQVTEAKRGPRYMLTYLHKKMKFNPRREGHESDLALKPVFSGGSAISMATATSGNTITTTMPISPPLPPIPSAYEKDMSKSGVFSKFKKRSKNKVPPSPMASPPVSDHEPLDHSDSDDLLTANAAVVSYCPSNNSISPTSSHGKKTLLPSSVSSKSAPLSTVPSRRKKTPSIFSMSLGKSSKRSPIKQIKKTHKYLANMGTIRLRGCEKRPFEIVVDPRFPHSYIDMDAVIRETTSAADKHKVNLLSASFQIVATPVYNAESEHNRVCIDIELVPKGVGYDTGSRPQSVTADNFMNVRQTPAAATSKSIFTKPTLSKAVLRKRAFNATPNFSLHSTIPQSTQNYAKTRVQTDVKTPDADAPATQREETTEERAQRIQNEAFASQWYEDSKDIIALMTLSPYNCVLGQDWLNKLYQSAYKTPLSKVSEQAEDDD